MPDDEIKDTSEKKLTFAGSDLEAVSISDEDLEQEDQIKRTAKKQAKKMAKKQRTPEEKKRLRRKKLIITGAVTATLLVIVLAIPITRWPVLNTIGFRSSLLITLHQQKTGQPIAGARATLDETLHGTTDEFGRVRFERAKLGSRKLQIQKTGYAHLTTTVANGFGTTQLKPLELQVVGIKVGIIVKDWLSGDPITGVKAVSGEADALGNENGQIDLIIAPTDEDSVEVVLSADGYHKKTITTAISTKTREITLVASQKNYFISNRNGRYDIYASHLDGLSQRKVIEATGKENRYIIQFSIHPDNKKAVLVANREGLQRNGYHIAGIYVVNLESASLEKIDEGINTSLLGWAGDRLVYQKSDPGLAYDHASYTSLTAYNTATKQRINIASYNYFSVALLASGRVFYVPGDAHRALKNTALTSYDLATSTTRQYLKDQPIAYVAHPSYTSLELQLTGGQKYEVATDTGALQQIDREPGDSKLFALSPDGKQTIWADYRDGQGALLLKEIGAGSEKIIAKIGGLSSPTRFIGGSRAIVRVATSAETADYVVHIPSGKFSKVTDVVNIGHFPYDGI